MYLNPDQSLATSRLELRLVTNDDLDAFCTIVKSSPSLHQWLDWCHPDFDREEGYDFLLANRLNWLKGLAYGFGVFLRDSDELVGMVALTERSLCFNMGSVGYWVADNHQKQGYAKEALFKLSQFCFEQVKLTRLEIVCDIDNQTSHYVARSLGATQESIARNRFIHDGKTKDGVVFSLIPEDLNLIRKK